MTASSPARDKFCVRRVVAGAAAARTAAGAISTITGEPLPAVKMPGDEVFAGTLNGPGALRVRVGRAASDTVVARIVAMVAEASATKARTQLFIEKTEQRYSADMVAAGVLLLAVPLLAGAAFQPALLRAMTFMIVASPCAVVLTNDAAAAGLDRQRGTARGAGQIRSGDGAGGQHDLGGVRQDRHPH